MYAWRCLEAKRTLSLAKIVYVELFCDSSVWEREEKGSLHWSWSLNVSASLHSCTNCFLFDFEYVYKCINLYIEKLIFNTCTVCSCRHNDFWQHWEGFELLPWFWNQTQHFSSLQGFVSMNVILFIRRLSVCHTLNSRVHARVSPAVLYNGDSNL